jgi:hypothetical protein
MSMTKRIIENIEFQFPDDLDYCYEQYLLENQKKSRKQDIDRLIDYEVENKIARDGMRYIDHQIISLNYC